MILGGSGVSILSDGLMEISTQPSRDRALQTESWNCCKMQQHSHEHIFAYHKLCNKHCRSQGFFGLPTWSLPVPFAIADPHALHCMSKIVPSSLIVTGCEFEVVEAPLEEPVLSHYRAAARMWNQLRREFLYAAEQASPASTALTLGICDICTP